jgi:hypothetical protein
VHIVIVSAELRNARRVSLQLPIEVAGVPGVTVDISATGIAFESLALLHPGEEVVLRIATSPDGGESSEGIRCRARVVRVDRRRYVENGRETVRIGATVRWIDQPGSGWFDLVSEARIA